MTRELQQFNLDNTQEVTSCFAEFSVRCLRMDDYVSLHFEVKDKPQVPDCLKTRFCVYQL